MLKKLVVTSLLIAQTLFAAETDVSKVVKLANTVKSVALTSEAPQENINEAEVKLREVIELLTSESSSPNTGSSEFLACYDFAYKKYYASLSSKDAADRATLACKDGLDLEIAQYLYDKYYANSTAAEAIDKATSGAKKTQRGKLPLIKFMYEKYYASSTSTEAINKAIEGAAKLKRNSLECLQKLYANYYSSQSSNEAMNSAIAACATK